MSCTSPSSSAVRPWSHGCSKTNTCKTIDRSSCKPRPPATSSRCTPSLIGTLVRSLVSCRGAPSYYGETPLGFACCTNQWDIVEILLRYGANMNTVCCPSSTKGNIRVACRWTPMGITSCTCWSSATCRRSTLSSRPVGWRSRSLTSLTVSRHENSNLPNCGII